MRDLLDSLDSSIVDHRIAWGRYVDVLNFLGLEQLPLEIHQCVLRGCVPTVTMMRSSSAKQLRTRYYPNEPHEYESRFQSVIRNIRSAGEIPTANDFNFILEHFAAVGHYLGSRWVLKEMVFLNVEPRTKTYGLCLQALAHRLRLPCAEELRPRLLEDVTATCRELINDMWANNRPFTSVNMDLAIRILREVSDDEGFDRLLKLGYGIDLSFPDGMPAELTDREISTAVSQGTKTTRPSLQPLSTAALNTIIDTLGRSGRISKMVLAFEVLTQPLPQTSTPPSSFEDEEDDNFPQSSSSLPQYRFPHAKPNITTYNMLVRHAAKAGHAVFARHYVLQALEQDRIEDRRVRGDVLRLPLDSIVAPSLAVNRGTLLPIFGEANRDKNIELMRFTHKAIERILRRKNADILYYEKWKVTRLGEEPDSIEAEFVPETQEEGISIDDSVDSVAPLSFFTPSTSTNSASSPTLSLPDVDSDTPAISPPPAPKVFNFNLHLDILYRDRAELEELLNRVNDVLSRTLQRVKERLGRRVWGAKDIYLATQGRSQVSREHWRKIVRYKDVIRPQRSSTTARSGARTSSSRQQWHSPSPS